MMESETSKDIRVRPSSFALWCGILAGPIAWAINLQLRYALVPWACSNGSRWTLTVISIPLLILSLVGGFLSWQGWVLGDDETLVPKRVRFMALGGLMLSAVFALAIVASVIPDFFLSPCN